MKRTLSALLAVLFLLSLSLTGCVIVKEDTGNLETRQFDFNGFTGVSISSAFEYEIVSAEDHSVSITADSELFEYISVTQKGHMLDIGFDHFPRPGWIWGSGRFQARIAMPQLTEADISGASEGTITGFTSEQDLDIDLSGASSLEITDTAAGNINYDLSGASEVEGDIKASGNVTLDLSGASMITADIEAGGNIELELSGASQLEMTGLAQNLHIEGSGASDLDLGGLAVHDADVTLSGASNATINMDGKLDAELSGASVLEYYGEPTLGITDITGASSLSRK